MSASLPAPAPTKSAISSATLPSGAPSFATVAAPTYCAVAARTPYITPRLKPVPLGSRPSTNVDNVPAILLTQAEEDQLRKQRENTLIMKFQPAIRRSMKLDRISIVSGNWTALQR